MLEDEGAGEAEHDAEGHRDGELEEEDGDTVEERGSKDVFAVELRQGPEARESTRVRPSIRWKTRLTLDALVKDDGDSIVQEGLSKDDRVELGVDLIGVEDGKDRHGVGRREGGTEDKALEKRQLETLEPSEGPEVDEDAEEQSGHRSSRQGDTCEGLRREDDAPQTDGRNEGPNESEGKNHAKVPEEVLLAGRKGKRGEMERL